MRGPASPAVALAAAAAAHADSCATGYAAICSITLDEAQTDTNRNRHRRYERTDVEKPHVCMYVRGTCGTRVRRKQLNVILFCCRCSFLAWSHSLHHPRHLRYSSLSLTLSLSFSLIVGPKLNKHCYLHSISGELTSLIVQSEYECRRRVLPQKKHRAKRDPIHVVGFCELVILPGAFTLTEYRQAET